MFRVGGWVRWKEHMGGRVEFELDRKLQEDKSRFGPGPFELAEVEAVPDDQVNLVGDDYRVSLKLANGETSGLLSGMFFLPE